MYNTNLICIINVLTICWMPTEEGEVPDWLVRELRECMRFRDVIHDHVHRILGLAVDIESVYIMYTEAANLTLKEYLHKEAEAVTLTSLLRT